MKHKHHIKPKHRGGTDDDGVVEVTTTCHAMFHWCEWKLHGHEQDKIAWQCLSGQIGGEEARVAAIRAVCKKRRGVQPKQLINTPESLARRDKKRRANPDDVWHGKFYEVTFKTGRVCVIRNLRKFCREGDYERRLLYRAMKGGWAHKDIKSIQPVSP